MLKFDFNLTEGNSFFLLSILRDALFISLRMAFAISAFISQLIAFALLCPFVSHQ